MPMLTVADMPAGFAALTAANLARLHLSDEDLKPAFGKAFASAEPHHYRGFVNGSGLVSNWRWPVSCTR